MHFRAFHGATSRNSVYRHHFAAVRVAAFRPVRPIGTVTRPGRLDYPQGMTFAKTGDVRPYVVAMVLSALATACGSSGLPAAPSPSLTPEGYAGRWSGTTSMGTAIDFTVAANGSVTAIAVGYNGDGCSGMNTYAEVDVEIRNPYSSLGRPQFQYSSGSPDSVALTVV